LLRKAVGTVPNPVDPAMSVSPGIAETVVISPFSATLPTVDQEVPDQYRSRFNDGETTPVRTIAKT